MPCSTLVHLLVSSILHSSEHIKFPPSAQHNLYPLKLSTDGFSHRGRGIFLGISWLETHNPMVDWCTRSITFPQAPMQVLSTNTVTCVGAAFSLGAHRFCFQLSLRRCPLCHKTSLFLSPICPQGIAIFWTCWKSEMPIDCRHIAPMIAQLNSKRAHTHHLGPSMGYLNLNLRPFTCI